MVVVMLLCLVARLWLLCAVLWCSCGRWWWRWLWEVVGRMPVFVFRVVSSVSKTQVKTGGNRRTKPPRTAPDDVFFCS